ncbi:MAG TPA: tRNA lysidine(34) synthetase TilS [Bacteroidales bacterium]|nr:tRNA lysidine(34) synthetase TilS [Bacteroidales bacterium]
MGTDLIQGFLEYSRLQELFDPSDLILVAVSGGKDSMALADCLIRIGQPMVVAHCNFGLRAGESDEEERFVNDYFANRSIPVRTRTFPTREYAESQGISIEMAARDLRYEWFEEVRRDLSCSVIAVGHHADDSIETSLINLIRGTGLRGLSGIRPRAGYVVRPLLFASREQIRTYINSRNIPFREDSSNRDVSIIRNRIRHVVIPILESMNPGIRSVITEEQACFAKAQHLIDNYVKVYDQKVIRADDGTINIPFTGILNSEFPEIILFEMLRPYGFHGKIIPVILRSLQGSSGKTFLSRTHQLLIDRDSILVYFPGAKSDYRYYLDPADPGSMEEAGFEAELHTAGPFVPSADPWCAWLDFDALEFPLVVRPWQAGDYFVPLGMNHKKKVSDFFIDSKISRLTKSQTPVVLSGGQIAWIPGHRIDHRSRITDATTNVLILRKL